MQRVTSSGPADKLPANMWLSRRRNYFIRKFYALFCTNYTEFAHQYEKFLHSRGAKTPTMDLPVVPESLHQLNELSHTLWSEKSRAEPHSQRFNWGVQALFHAAVKLQANINMVRFHTETLTAEPADTSQIGFIDTTLEEIQQQAAALSLLFDRAKELLHLMLAEQTGNDLLLRLLIEEELGQSLWGKSTLELFSHMFPYQPETGYVQAGKSYFMGQWLPESLKAYEESLAINPDLSEPRRQTYIIRAMLRDRDHLKN